MIAAYRKIIDLLDARERRWFAGLVVLTIFMGLVDVLGVASIVPFLSVIASPDLVERSRALGLLRDWSGASTHSEFLVVLGVVVFCTVVIGLTTRAATFYALTRFTRMRVPSLGGRLLEKYLARPYEWYLSRNTADLGKALLSEVAVVVDGPIDAAMRLIGHGAISLFMVLLLLAIEPVAALFAGAIAGLCYGAMMLYAHRRLARLGKIRHAANRERYQVTQEAMGGIKDVKILDLERTYLGRFRAPALRVADAQARADIMSELPRHALEGIAIGGMLLFVLWLIIRHDGALDAALPVLGAYAFAGARLFPEMQQIFRSMTRIRFGGAALDELHRDLVEGTGLPPEAGRDEVPIALRSRLSLDGVVYTYPGAAQPSLSGLTLEIEAKTTVGLVGATGAGKTTAIDVMLGLLAPQEGTLSADGVRITAENVRRWRRSIGYVPQSIFLTDDTVAANIAFGVRPEEANLEAVERAARIANLHDFVLHLPEGYNTVIGERGARLSGGQRQRVGIARALYRDPEVLIFDEATSALDNLTEKAVMEAVQALGRRKTIILIAHRLSTVRNCDRVFMLENGRVSASGTYDGLVGESAAFRAIHEAAW